VLSLFENRANGTMTRTFRGFGISSRHTGNNYFLKMLLDNVANHLFVCSNVYDRTTHYESRTFRMKHRERYTKLLAGRKNRFIVVVGDKCPGRSFIDEHKFTT
jgi:hypothetical protein